MGWMIELSYIDEEAILMKHLTENGLNSVYLPDIHVFHREDSIDR